MVSDTFSKKKPVITVSEARKILGAEYVDASDKEIETIIIELAALSAIFLLSEKGGENVKSS